MPEPRALEHIWDTLLPTYSRLDGITLGVGLAALKARVRPKSWEWLMERGNWLLCGSGVLLFASMIVISNATPSCVRPWASQH